MSITRTRRRCFQYKIGGTPKLEVFSEFSKDQKIRLDETRLKAGSRKQGGWPSKMHYFIPRKESRAACDMEVLRVK